MTSHLSQPPTPPGPLWTCDPIFGLVHKSDCRTCLQYMKHVAVASHAEDDVSFKDALKERDSKNTVRFLSGFFEGGRMQHAQDGDAEVIQIYRRERNEAREEASRNAAELLAVRDELHQVKEQLYVLHALFNEVADSAASQQLLRADQAAAVDAPNESFSEAAPSVGDGDPASTYRADLSPHAPQSPLPSASSTSKAYLPSPPPSPEWVPTAAPLPPSRSYTTDDVTATSFHPAAFDDVSDHLTNPAPSPCQEVPPQASDPATERLDSISPDSIEQLTVWMEEARTPGNVEGLGRVKALCTRAHLTPSSKRTDLQRYLLSEWKGPGISNHKNEMFVDSSAWGIGFFMNGRWLAWKLKSGWNAEGRDNNWSEMVAVELGLRVATSAGFHSAHFTVKSDNTGVIQALKTGKSNHSKQMEILREIIQLANMYSIVLEPVWVSTKHNLADKPSRGEFASKTLLYPVSPSLPSHLTQFINPSVDFHSLIQ